MTDRYGGKYDAPAAPSTQRVLVVDDDESIRCVLEGLLHAAGFDVATAASAFEAWRTLSRLCIDVVLTDVDLKGPNGIELLRALRARRPDIPVIVMTAVPTSADAGQVLALGASGYLAKPVEPPRLAAAIRNALAPPIVGC